MKFSKIINLLLVVVLSSSLFSCTDVLENSYSKKSAEGDLERIKAIGHLDSAEYYLLTDYMLKKGLIEPDLIYIHETYKKILETAKKEKVLSDMKLAADKKRKDYKGQFQMDQLDHLYDALIMLPEESTIRKDWSNRNAFFYKMVFVNPSEKPIRAFKGKFTFYDLFDTEIKSITFTYNDSIPARDTLIYNANIDLSQTSNNNIYYTKDFSDIKVIWKPSKIIYIDGTAVE